MDHFSGGVGRPFSLTTNQSTRMSKTTPRTNKRLMYAAKSTVESFQWSTEAYSQKQIDDSHVKYKLTYVFGKGDLPCAA